MDKPPKPKQRPTKIQAQTLAFKMEDQRIVKIPTSSKIRVPTEIKNQYGDYAKSDFVACKYQRYSRRFRLKQREEVTPAKETRLPATNPSENNRSNKNDSRLIDLQIKENESPRRTPKIICKEVNNSLHELQHACLDSNPFGSTTLSHMHSQQVSQKFPLQTSVSDTQLKQSPPRIVHKSEEFIGLA